jgi:hypothetical protein
VVYTFDMMSMLVVFAGIKVIIVNVHTVANGNSGTRVGFVMMCMSVFKNNIAFCIVNVASILALNWRRRYIEALMDMS